MKVIYRRNAGSTYYVEVVLTNGHGWDVMHERIYYNNPREATIHLLLRYTDAYTKVDVPTVSELLPDPLPEEFEVDDILALMELLK